MRNTLIILFVSLLIISCVTRRQSCDKSNCDVSKCNKLNHESRDSISNEINDQKEINLEDTLVKETQPDDSYFMIQDGFVKGVIFKESSDTTCGFLIRLEDNSILRPIKLNDDFKQEKLRVWIKYKEVRPLARKCTLGRVVEVLRIKKIN